MYICNSLPSEALTAFPVQTRRFFHSTIKFKVARGKGRSRRRKGKEIYIYIYIEVSVCPR